MLRAFGCRGPIDGYPSMKVQNVVIGSSARILKTSCSISGITTTTTAPIPPLRDKRPIGRQRTHNLLRNFTPINGSPTVAGFIRLPSPLDIPKNLRLLPLFASRPAGILPQETNQCFAALFNLLRFGRFSMANGFGFHNEAARCYKCNP
jgi:hypothetical protein